MRIERTISGKKKSPLNGCHRGEGKSDNHLADSKLYNKPTSNITVWSGAPNKIMRDSLRKLSFLPACKYPA
jgi:hypothetical protein